MNKNAKYVIAGGVIFFVFAGLLYRGLNRSMMAYVNVSEIHEATRVFPEGTAQITGIVRPGSIHQDGGPQRITFILQDINKPTHNIPVVYNGVLPDNFKPGLQVVVRGTIQENKLIVAQHILTKCPSKYNEQQ